MTTWADVIDDLILDMDDNADRPKLDADKAFLYGKMAIRDYSRWNPLIQFGTLQLSSTGQADLPTDFISMIEVRDGDGDLILPLVDAFNPPAYTLLTSQYRWWVEGKQFRMNTYADTPATVSILYRAYHAIPANSSATGTVMTYPDADEEAILLYIRAKHMGTVRSKQSRADRYKRRVDAGNTRTDNPIRPEEQNLMDEYIMFMSERYATGSKRLVRQRR
jgi:hypothetical protein